MWNDLLELVCRVPFRLGFVIVILQYDIPNGKLRKKYMCVVSERGGSIGDTKTIY